LSAIQLQVARGNLPAIIGAIENARYRKPLRDPTA